MTREEAWDLLKEYNQDEFHLEHAEIVGKTMRYFAGKLGYEDEQDFWEVVGILHDLDFEMYPEQHCIKEQELMRPSKSVQDLELKSVKKKYKSKGFAAGCSREVIERGAEMLGWTLDDLITQTIEALRTFRP